MVSCGREKEMNMKDPVLFVILGATILMVAYIITIPIYTPSDSTCMDIQQQQDEHLSNETQIIRFHVYAQGRDATDFQVIAREMCGGTIENITDKNGISYLLLNPSQRHALTFFNESCTLITLYSFWKDNDYNIFIKNCDVK
jgi:hypothetical protein